jgi:hypothetical protein
MSSNCQNLLSTFVPLGFAKNRNIKNCRTSTIHKSGHNFDQRMAVGKYIIEPSIIICPPSAQAPLGKKRNESVVKLALLVQPHMILEG